MFFSDITERILIFFKLKKSSHKVKQRKWKNKSVTKYSQKLKRLANKNTVKQRPHLKGQLETFREYCESAWIGGLRHIFGKSHAKFCRPTWLIWLVIWLFTVSICGWSCAKIVQQYMQFDVKTQFVYQPTSKINFPAITLCNQNIYRKLIYAGTYSLWIAFAKWFAEREQDIPYLVKANNRSCYTANRSKYSLEMDDIEEYWAKNGYTANGSSWLMGHENSVVKCVWNNNQDCKNMLLNALRDYGYCFSFSPAELNNSTVTETAKSVYTVTSLKADRISVNPGEQYGFRLLLNTWQEEYCSAAHIWQGAGFLMKVHDYRIQPSFLTDTSVHFSPGYSYKVVLSPVVYKRNTEHLGHCKSSKYYSLFTDLDFYSKEMCELECFIKKVWYTCSCYMFAFAGSEKVYADTFKVPLSSVKMCQDEKSVTCLLAVKMYFLSHHVTYDLCKECKNPCLENKYYTQISQSLLSAVQVLPFFDNITLKKIDSKIIRKNYVDINFFFDTNLYTEWIIESQAFTPRDLFVYFGGRIGLFMGMSVVSVVEIVYRIYVSLYFLTHKIIKFSNKSPTNPCISVDFSRSRSTIVHVKPCHKCSTGYKRKSCTPAWSEVQV